MSQSNNITSTTQDKPERNIVEKFITSLWNSMMGKDKKEKEEKENHENGICDRTIVGEEPVSERFKKQEKAAKANLKHGSSEAAFDGPRLY